MDTITPVPWDGTWDGTWDVWGAWGPCPFRLSETIASKRDFQDGPGSARDMSPGAGVSLCGGAFLEAGQVDSFLPLSSRCRGPGGIDEGWAQLQRRATTQVDNGGRCPLAEAVKP